MRNVLKEAKGKYPPAQYLKIFINVRFPENKEDPYVKLKELSLTLAGLLFLVALSCTPDEEKITTHEAADLTFSVDTVRFDTIFTSVGSITKRLSVRNRNQRAVEITRISLGRSTGSPYRIMVNGKQGTHFEGEVLFGGDSLLVLVEVTIDPREENLPFLVRDSLVFETNHNLQDVKLIAYGQDAHFIHREVLSGHTHWTAEKPYVLSDTILVDSLSQLTIEEGAKIYFDYNASLFVGGTLAVNGTVENKVLFRNSRLDVKEAFGQWGGIYFLEGSKNNLIDFAVIRNGTVGAYVGTPDEDNTEDLVISNTIIENMANAGLLAFNSDVYVYNTLINNCVQYIVGNFAGGNYRYTHCTFVNFGFGFFRDAPSAVFSDNVVLADDHVLTNDLVLEMGNTIVYGSLNEELLLNNGGGSVFTVNITNSLLKTRLEELDINKNVLNEDPKFIHPGIYNYQLDTLSPAKDAGADLMITLDLNGAERDAAPDIGAYERIEE